MSDNEARAVARWLRRALPEREFAALQGEAGWLLSQQAGDDGPTAIARAIIEEQASEAVAA